MFEKGVTKTGGGDGFADVWRKGFFAWEYKKKKRNLDDALGQLVRCAAAQRTNCPSASSRLRFFFLYSQAKKPFLQTSAKPSPPPVLVTPFSNMNYSPTGSAVIGPSCPSGAQRSRNAPAPQHAR